MVQRVFCKFILSIHYSLMFIKSFRKHLHQHLLSLGKTTMLLAPITIILLMAKNLSIKLIQTNID